MIRTALLRRHSPSAPRSATGSPARRTTVAAWLAAGLLLSGVVACSSEQTAPESAVLSWQASSVNGAFTATLAPQRADIPLNEYHDWLITLKDARSQPVEGARLSLDGGMPAHGHGLPSTPQVSEYLGNGQYRIEGMRFNMGGEWVLEFRAQTPSFADRVTFHLQISY